MPVLAAGVTVSATITATITGGSPAVPDTVVGLSGSNLVRFSAAMPAVVITTTVLGLVPGDPLEGIDLRPRDGGLYGVSTAGRIFLVDPQTGAAALVGQLTATTGGARVGLDFNPAADALRIVDDNQTNLRRPFPGGPTFVDSPLSVPSISAAAYSNNVDGATTTTSKPATGSCTSSPHRTTGRWRSSGSSACLRPAPTRGSRLPPRAGLT